MIRKLPPESNHKRRSRQGCIVVILCVGFFRTVCVCVFLTLMYLYGYHSRGLCDSEINARSSCGCLMFFLMEESLACRTLG